MLDTAPQCEHDADQAQRDQRRATILCENRKEHHGEQDRRHRKPALPRARCQPPVAVGHCTEPEPLAVVGLHVSMLSQGRCGDPVCASAAVVDDLAVDDSCDDLDVRDALGRDREDVFGQDHGIAQHPGGQPAFLMLGELCVCAL